MSSIGLFSRAIAQSEAALNPWVLQRRPQETAFRLGAALGFKGGVPEDLVEFLRGVDHMTLVKAALDHGLSDQHKKRLLAFSFTPSLEIEVEGVERFLPDNPFTLLEEGRYHDVPYLTGVTDKDGIVMTQFPNFSKDEEVAKLEKDLGEIIRSDLRLPEDYEKIDNVISKIRHFYLEDKPVSRETVSGFIDLLTDLQFAEGIHMVVKKMAQLAKAPVYQYLFSYDGKLNIFKVDIGVPYTGACHGDDLGYLFRTRLIDPDLPPDSTEALIRSRMVRLWTNYAKTGNPTTEGDPLLPVTWEPHTAANPCYLEINEKLSVHKHLLKERMEFWEELYRNL